MKILMLNAGSSSQKSRVYELAGSLPGLAPTPHWQADTDWTLLQGITELKISTAGGAVLEENLNTDALPAVIMHMLKTRWSGKTQVIAQASEIDIVGHRVVHGGREFEKSTLVMPEVKTAISRIGPIGVFLTKRCNRICSNGSRRAPGVPDES